jgi:hypothetical protein
MGLAKRDTFDHSLEPAFAAAGYSAETVAKELEPRAALLAYKIVEAAGMCPTMAIELLMGSPILEEPDLDNRDRAVIVLLAGPVLASHIVKQAMENPDGLQKACISSHGFEHNSGKEQNEVLKLSRAKWDDLVRYSENKVFKGRGQIKVSELVENMEKFLDDQALTRLEKAIVEGLVVKRSAMQAAAAIASASGVIGPLAVLDRPAA